MVGSLRKIGKTVAAVVRAKVSGETWLECSARVLDSATESEAIAGLKQLNEALCVQPEAAAARDDVGRAA